MGVALAPLALAAGVAGTAVSAYGQYQSGQAGARAASYQAAVAANNAEIARRNAVMEIQSGETAAVNRGLATRSKVASEKAAQGAAGIDVNTGSAAAVRAGTAEIGMLDALTLRSDAAKRAYSQEVGAQSFEEQSHLDTMKADQMETAGAIGAAGTLLSGASTVGRDFGRYQTQFGRTDTVG